MTTAFELDRFLPYLLNQAAEQASLKFSRIYRERYGLGRTEWRVLAHLGQFGSMTATDICHRAREEKTGVSRTVSRLEGMGFLRRRRDPRDRRAELLELTIAGREVFDDLSREALAFDRALQEQMGGAAVETLRTALTEIMARPPQT